MKKLILILFCCLALPFNLNAEKRKLALSAPLTGGGAGWGSDVKNVLTFANEKLANNKYRLIFEDDRCDLKLARTVANKLINIDKVKEVFTVCGQVTLAAGDIYKRAGVTVMAPLATPSRISELGVFRTSMSDKFASQMLAEFIFQRHKSISCLTEENDYSVSFLKDFEEYSKNYDLKTSNEFYLSSQTDFKPQLLKLKQNKAEALFLNTQTEEALTLLVKQLKEIEYAPKLYGAYLPGSANFLKTAGKLAEGLVFVDFPGAAEMLTLEGKELFAEYTQRYGPIHGWSFAFPASFEAFRSIHLAVSSGQNVKDFLKNEEFNGIFGPYSFDKNGDIVGPKHVLRTITGGKAKLLKSL